MSQVVIALPNKPVYSLWSSTEAKNRFSLRVGHKLCVENISEKLGISIWAEQLQGICNNPKHCSLEIFLGDKCRKNLIAVGETNINTGASTVSIKNKKYYVYSNNYYIMIMDAL